LARCGHEPEFAALGDCLYFARNTLPMDQIVRITEKVMGQKWEITKRSPAEIEKEIAVERDETKKLWLQLELVYASDAIEEGVLEPQLNRLFPDLKPLSIEEYIRRYYG
jgi:hypothetical protein